MKQKKTEIKIRVKFIWFDLWIGLFIDIEKKKIYIAPLPCVVIIISKEKWVCKKCGNRGWLFDENGYRYGTCPCHYL